MQIFATWTGADFLAFYGVMLVTCIGLSVWFPANLRPEGRMAEIDDAEELAVLAGGAPRHALTVLAHLVAHRAVSPLDSKKLYATATPAGHGRAASAVLRSDGDFTLGDVRRKLKVHADRIAHDLMRRGLLMRDGDRTRLRWLSIAPIIALFLIGLYRQQAGSAVGEPTGFLIALMGLTVGCAVVRLTTINPRTLAGNEVLNDWYGRASRLHRAPQSSEAALAVSLFGTAVLVGTPFEFLHAAQQGAASGSSGCGGVGGSDGGSGCGGGGCGGCGG